MTNFFETENLDTANSGLRDHQQDAFNDIIESLSQGQKSGFVEMATGSGKTAIISKLAELYITNSQSKVVILAPSVPICQQIQQEIIKHTKISDSSITFLYQGQTIDPDADIIISTYQSFVSKGTDFDEVGLMLADECHRSLGPITSKVVKHSYPNSYKIGFSATPSFRANRRSEELFGQPMHKLSLGDAIESGVTQPVEAFVYKTGAELSLNDASDNDFTYSELEPLMNNAARNRAGIDLTKELVASGRQGIVNCIAGKSNAHARALAEILSGSTVLMPNGQTRKIIAKSVGNHLTKQEQTAILEDYEAGKIDVLTFTKALEEGWDSQRASFAINLRPTTSELKIKQLLGRILRKKTEDSRPSIYIDLIDKTEQYKPIYTGLHALDFRDGQGTGSNLDTTDRQYASSKTETSKKDTNYKALVLSQYLLEQIITTKSEIDQFERLSQARKASNILSKEQFRELREIVSPSYDPTFYRHNMKLIKNPPRLSPANQDLLYLEELSSYAEQLAEQQQNDGELNSLFVGAGSELDELTNRLAEITEGHSLPKHMARILFLHSGYFQTDSYTTDDHAPAPQQALSPERHAEKVLLEEQLKSVLDTLSEREAGIIRMRYGFYTGQPATLNEIGKTYGLSRERIRMIEYLAMRKLRHPSRSEELQDYRDDYTYSIDERVFKPLTRREAEDKKRSHYEKKLLEEAGILSRSSKHEVTPEALKWAANLISRLPEKLSESGPLYSLQALFNTWQSDFHVAVINEVFKSHASYNHINKRTVIERLAEFLEPEQHNQLVAELASGVSEKTLLSAEILKGEDYLLLNRQQLGLFLGIKPRHFALLIKSIPEIDSPLSTTQRTKYSPSEIYKIIENLKYRGVISQNNTGVFETNYAHLYASLIKQAKKDEAKIEALNKILSDSKG